MIATSIEIKHRAICPAADFTVIVKVPEFSNSAKETKVSVIPGALRVMGVTYEKGIITIDFPVTAESCDSTINSFSRRVKCASHYDDIYDIIYNAVDKVFTKTPNKPYDKLDLFTTHATVQFLMAVELLDYPSKFLYDNLAYASCGSVLLTVQQLHHNMQEQKFNGNNKYLHNYVRSCFLCLQSMSAKRFAKNINCRDLARLSMELFSATGRHGFADVNDLINHLDALRARPADDKGYARDDMDLPDECEWDYYFESMRTSEEDNS